MVLKPGYTTERGRLETKIDALEKEIQTQLRYSGGEEGEFIRVMRVELRGRKERLQALTEGE